MNLALAYLWKEWRAQRGLLVAYTVLITACLCLGLYLAPRHAWFEEDFGVHALSWFFLAGVIGVVVFAVPSLVRGEFVAQKGDQFVRRLPGALWPAFQGKLLFLVLASLLLPLLGLLCGELFLTAIGQDWRGLYGWSWTDTQPVYLRLPWQVWWGLAAFLVVPWIWAAGTWTPGGRLAALASTLLALLLGVAVFAVVRQCPKLLDGFDPKAWLWAVPATGLVTAAVSWVRGRRGGGPLRSARVGLTATAVFVAPIAGWLGERAWRYHHPRADRLAQLQVHGLSRDGRFVLAAVSESEAWYGANVRIDLSNGASQRLGGSFETFSPSVARPFRLAMYGRQDLWRHYHIDGERHVYDLAADVWFAQPGDLQEQPLPSGLEQRVWHERRESTPFRAPGDVKVWIDRGDVCFAASDGSVERVRGIFAGDAHRGAVGARGHALRLLPSEDVFDLARRERIATCDFVVGGVRLRRPGFAVRRVGWKEPWLRQIDGGDYEPWPWSSGLHIHGLLDDAHVLASRGAELLSLDPRTGGCTAFDLPVGGQPHGSWQADARITGFYAVAPMARNGSLIERDPHGRVWVCVAVGERRVFLRLDTDAMRATAWLPHEDHDPQNVLSWDDRGVVVASLRSAEIVRYDFDGNRIERLFPRGGEGR